MTYRCVVADPPWPYRDRATRGAAARHYPTLPVEAIAALPVRELAGPDAHLWLWTTNAMLADGTAIEVAKAWGFSPKTILTWCKARSDGRPQIGVGHYLRGATEHVLFCVRGRLPVGDRSVPSWFVAPRREHSRKPEAAYRIIERVSPGPYLELFARRRRPGWDAWGDELSGGLPEAVERRLAAWARAHSEGVKA